MIVFFDLDGTLLRGTTVSAALAEWLGRGGELNELERAYAAGDVSNAAVADASAAWFAGRRVADAAAALETLTWIEGLEEVVRAVDFSAIATVTWSWAAECVARRFGFDAWCGTEMVVDDGVLGGTVARHFDAEDKAEFIERVCRSRRLNPSAAAMVGDSRSDLPAFARVGYSIALNADAAARKAATVSIDTDDLRDLLPLLRGRD